MNIPVTLACGPYDRTLALALGDVRAGRVDPGVDPELRVRRPVTLELVAVQIEDEQPLRISQGRAGTSWEDEAIGPRNPGADVAEARRQAGAMDDPIRQCDIATERGET